MKNVALVTGASSGLGKEFANIHAERGGDLVIVARSQEKLNELKLELEEKHKIKVLVIVKDLSLSYAAAEVYDEVSKKGIKVDYLINNAGFGGVGEFHERKIEVDLSMIYLNIISLTTLCHLFLKDFLKQKEGKILNVSSTASLMPGPLQAVYFATKAFVTSFSNAIAEELRDTDVSVTNLMPGATETNFGKVSGMDKTSMFAKTAKARKVAEDGYDGMMAARLNVISGLTFSQRVMLAIIPFIPKKVQLRIVKKMQGIN